MQEHSESVAVKSSLLETTPHGEAEHSFFLMQSERLEVRRSHVYYSPFMRSWLTGDWEESEVGRPSLQQGRRAYHRQSTQSSSQLGPRWNTSAYLLE